MNARGGFLRTKEVRVAFSDLDCLHLDAFGAQRFLVVKSVEKLTVVFELCFAQKAKTSP